MIGDLSDLGAVVAAAFWVPVLVWSLCAYLVARILTNSRHPIGADVRYVATVALLVGLPLGLATGQLFGGLAPASTSTFVAMDSANAAGASVIDSAGDVEPALAASTVRELGGELVDQPLSVATPTSPTLRTSPTSTTEIVPSVAGPFERRAPVLRSLFLFVGFVTCILLLYSVLLAGHLIAQLARVHRLRRLPEVDDTGALRVFNRIRSRIAIRRSVRLLVGPDRLAPMTFGLLKPVVVVPSKLLPDAPALEAALAHELQHVRRNDYAVGLLLRLITLPVAWHPLVGNLLREMEDARESLCDYRVIGDGGVPLQVYATTLLHFAGNRAARQFYPALAAPSGQLKKRIQAMRQIMNERTPARITRRALPTLTGVLLLGAALFATACSSPSTSNQATPASSGAAEFTDLPSLELQVEYLIQEIERLEEESAAMLATVEGNEEQYELRQTIAWSVLSQRKLLLGQVLSEKLRERELARMEAAVGLTVTG